MRLSTRGPGSSASAIPGGPGIDNIADQGDPAAFAFPLFYALADGYDFWFSGLKTSVVNTVRKHPEASYRRRGRFVPRGGGRRARDPGPPGGCSTSGPRRCAWLGVVVDFLSRRRVEEACAEDGIGAFLPSRALCTDNAAMVAAAPDGGGSTTARPARSRWAQTRTQVGALP